MLRRACILISILVCIAVVFTGMTMYRRITRGKPEDHPNQIAVLFPMGLYPSAYQWITPTLILLSQNNTLILYDTLKRETNILYRSPYNIEQISLSGDTIWLIEKGTVNSIRKINADTHEIVDQQPLTALVTIENDSLCVTTINDILHPHDIASVTKITNLTTQETKTYSFNHTVRPAWCDSSPFFIPAVPILPVDLFHVIDDEQQIMSLLDGIAEQHERRHLKISPPSVSVMTNDAIISLYLDTETGTSTVTQTITLPDTDLPWIPTENGDLILLNTEDITIYRDGDIFESITLPSHITRFSSITPNDAMTGFLIIDQSGEAWVAMCEK